jgi:hypothetical protein
VAFQLQLAALQCPSNRQQPVANQARQQGSTGCVQGRGTSSSRARKSMAKSVARNRPRSWRSRGCRSRSPEGARCTSAQHDGAKRKQRAAKRIGAVAGTLRARRDMASERRSGQ